MNWVRVYGICSNCGGRFNIDSLDSIYGFHDGWELPPYTEYYCPVCEDGGCIDDFYEENDDELC